MSDQPYRRGISYQPGEIVIWIGYPQPVKRHARIVARAGTSDGGSAVWRIHSRQHFLFDCADDCGTCNREVTEDRLRPHQWCEECPPPDLRAVD